MNLNFIYLKTEQKALGHIYFLFLSTLIFRDFIAWLEHSALPEIPESRCMLYVNNRNKFHSCSTLSEFDQGEKLRVHVAFFEQVF